MKTTARAAALWAVIAATMILVGLSPVTLARGVEGFLATLSSQERTQFEAYLAATRVHEARLDSYWSEVQTRKTERRRKRVAKARVTPQDYVNTYPPAYNGPKLDAGLSKRWAAYLAKDAVKRPPPKQLPGLPEFLSYAKTYYGFEPERIPEREFKRRYAREALTVGLSKDQVVRIYALETSGLGQADMVAGIHPIRKTGKPISSAMGYAQLLAANTINELAKSGPNFVERLRALAALQPHRAAQINSKIVSLKKMIAVARSVPEKWSQQVALSRTPKGQGMHAINIDGDIGPWLQVIKIKGLQISARRRGITSLSGSEIELMNLAGPGTGLEMMTPAARDAPTTNFFARNAYARNTIVRGKTSAQLIVALDERMDQNIKNSGAVEFAAVFDELQGILTPPAPARAVRGDAYIPPKPF